MDEQGREPDRAQDLWGSVRLSGPGCLLLGLQERWPGLFSLEPRGVVTRQRRAATLLTERLDSLDLESELAWWKSQGASPLPPAAQMLSTADSAPEAGGPHPPAPMWPSTEHPMLQ